MRTLLAVSVLSIGTMTSACTNRNIEQGELSDTSNPTTPIVDSTAPGSSISEVLASHSAEILEIKGVTGIGEGRKQGKPAVVVFCEKLTTELQRKVPKTLEGYPVVIEQIGVVRAQ